LKVFGLETDLEGSQRDLDKAKIISRLWGDEYKKYCKLKLAVPIVKFQGVCVREEIRI